MNLIWLLGSSIFFGSFSCGWVLSLVLTLPELLRNRILIVDALLLGLVCAACEGDRILQARQKDMLVCIIPVRHNQLSMGSGMIVPHTLVPHNLFSWENPS